MQLGGVLTISSRLVSVRRSGNHFGCVEFKDTGVGMSEVRRRELFSSVLTSSKPKGSGLGLAIVGRIIEAHNGRLQIKSSQGKGTTVRIILPVDQRDKASPAPK
jgi:signal transduction histidine kinase